MKTVKFQFYLILFLFVFINIGKSQYITTLQENSEWYTYFHWENYYSSYFEYINGETLINGNLYKEIVRSNDYEYDINYVREDIENKLIYQRLNNTDFILYDYNLSVGDTFHYDNPQWVNTDYYLVLDSITDSIYTYPGNFLEYNLETTRAFYFHNAYSPFYNNIVWVEGIGSLAGILYSYVDWHYDSDILLCHYNENGIRDFHYIYIEEPSPCQGFVGVTENLSESYFKLFPNPITNDILHIEGSEITSIEIKGMDGRSLCKVVNIEDSKELSISTENLSKGIYLIQINFGINQLSTKKIVKL